MFTDPTEKIKMRYLNNKKRNPMIYFLFLSKKNAVKLEYYYS